MLFKSRVCTYVTYVLLHYMYGNATMICNINCQWESMYCHHRRSSHPLICPPFSFRMSFFVCPYSIRYGVNEAEIEESLIAFVDEYIIWSRSTKILKYFKSSCCGSNQHWQLNFFVLQFAYTKLPTVIQHKSTEALVINRKSMFWLKFSAINDGNGRREGKSKKNTRMCNIEKRFMNDCITFF